MQHSKKKKTPADVTSIGGLVAKTLGRPPLVFAMPQVYTKYVICAKFSVFHTSAPCHGAPDVNR